MAVETRPQVDLLDGTFHGGDPLPAYAWMRRHEPVYRDEANALWGVTRWADIRRVGADPRTFSSAEGSRPDAPHMPFMNNYDDPEHRRRRGLVSQGFTPRRVADRAGRIREIVDGIIDDVAGRGECDFVRDVAAPLPLIVIGELLGFAREDFGELLRWSDEMVSALGAPEPGAMDVAVRAFADYSTYISRVIEECRRSGSRDDPVGVFVHAEFEGERLDHDSLVYETLNLLIGGDETTRHAISGGMYELLRERDRWELLRRERELVPSAVEEMLRWVSPIKGMARTATRDVELGGATVRAGDRLLLLYASANRDEEAFPEPDVFDVRRSPNDHVAFGHGPHFCLGAPLARLEMRTMFDRLLDRLPDIELATDERPPMRQANFITGFESMPVRFTPA